MTAGHRPPTRQEGDGDRPGRIGVMAVGRAVGIGVVVMNGELNFAVHHECSIAYPQRDGRAWIDAHQDA